MSESLANLHHVAAYDYLRAAEGYRSPDERADLLAFSEFFTHVSGTAHQDAVAKGWWEGDRNDGELLALVHSEISECLESLRKGNPPDEKCPEFSNTEIEAADAVIRLMDLSEARGWRLGAAIVAKLLYNRTRAYRHGGKAF